MCAHLNMPAQLPFTGFQRPWITSARPATARPAVAVGGKRRSMNYEMKSALRTPTPMPAPTEAFTFVKSPRPLSRRRRSDIGQEQRRPWTAAAAGSITSTSMPWTASAALQQQQQQQEAWLRPTNGSGAADAGATVDVLQPRPPSRPTTSPRSKDSAYGNALGARSIVDANVNRLVCTLPVAGCGG